MSALALGVLFMEKSSNDINKRRRRIVLLLQHNTLCQSYFPLFLLVVSFLSDNDKAQKEGL